ncbi:MAG: hypothetical protein IMZ58_07090 [Thermoplasmata archaeon]|nr:hypothetical protein [Thermoplasmata archaeon]
MCRAIRYRNTQYTYHYDHIFTIDCLVFVYLKRDYLSNTTTAIQSEQYSNSNTIVDIQKGGMT